MSAPRGRKRRRGSRTSNRAAADVGSNLGPVGDVGQGRAWPRASDHWRRARAGLERDATDRRRGRHVDAGGPDARDIVCRRDSN